MKTKLLIKNKNGDLLQFAIFEDQKSIDAFKDVLALGQSWGLPERWISQHDLTQDEIVKAIDFRIISNPGRPDFTEYKFAAEYTVETFDITAEVEADKAKKDKKKSDRTLRVEQLKNFDWTKIKKIDDALPLLKLLVDELIKDD